MKWSKVESQLIHESLMNWTIDDDDDDVTYDGEVQARSNWNPSWFLFLFFIFISTQSIQCMGILYKRRKTIEFYINYVLKILYHNYLKHKSKQKLSPTLINIIMGHYCNTKK